MKNSTEDDLLNRAACWPSDRELADLTQNRIQTIAATEGIDFATALLYNRILNSTEYRQAIEQLDELSESNAEQFPDNVTLAIAPGAFYVRYPHTGADGRLLRDEAAGIGLQSELIPVSTFGSLADNAQAICDWLLRRPADNRIVLASLSKGGSDVKMALARPEGERAFRNVAVWINLSGLLWGTPLVEWLLERQLRMMWVRFLFWMRGFEFDVVHELASRPGTPLDFPLRIPEHVYSIHVVGFPLERHLTNRLARRCFRRVRSHGPNDGAGVILSDVAGLPGVVYPLWGADHYLRPGGADASVLARRLLAAARSILMENECMAGKDGS